MEMGAGGAISGIDFIGDKCGRRAQSGGGGWWSSCVAAWPHESWRSARSLSPRVELHDVSAGGGHASRGRGRMPCFQRRVGLVLEAWDGVAAVAEDGDGVGRGRGRRRWLPVESFTSAMRVDAAGSTSRGRVGDDMRRVSGQGRGERSKAEIEIVLSDESHFVWLLGIGDGRARGPRLSSGGLHKYDVYDGLRSNERGSNSGGVGPGRWNIGRRASHHHMMAHQPISAEGPPFHPSQIAHLWGGKNSKMVIAPTRDIYQLQ
ncbi:hypothetical protein R3P38DRAFT_2797136 [Favolaschia claudopus]|uniref:Uncharacterized protein n=1 Tax=Favolaschia claudopus TaxID=2862362 RepID=A0AAW0A3Q6_9AGAR